MSIAFDVVTLFPDMFAALTDCGITRRAKEQGLWQLALWNPRDFTTDAYRTVDDRPYGGGPGMLLRPEPVVGCVEHILAARGPGHVVLLTPGGRTFTQAVAREYASKDHLVLVCGRYEGFDDRIRQVLRPDELSVGPYVLTGGEIAAMAVADAVVRLLPGALGDGESAVLESHADGDDLEAPQWTRPPRWRGHDVPDALLSGDHARIARWRAEESRRRTERRRREDGRG